MNLKQAAQVLGRSERWVSQQIHAGRLAATWRGRERVIAEADVARLGGELGVVTGLSTVDAHGQALQTVAEAVKDLRRHLVQLEYAVARQAGRTDAIERHLSYAATALGPKITLTPLEEFAYTHRIGSERLLRAMDAAGIPVAPVYGRATEPLIAPEAHTDIAAALRAQGVRFLPCPDCDRPIK
jgi:hypothetical protein